MEESLEEMNLPTNSSLQDREKKKAVRNDQVSQNEWYQVPRRKWIYQFYPLNNNNNNNDNDGNSDCKIKKKANGVDERWLRC